MAMAPTFKIYRDGLYVAAVKDPEDAAAVVAIIGDQVRLGHRRVLWDNAKDGPPIDYDVAAAAIITRAETTPGR